MVNKLRNPDLDGKLLHVKGNLYRVPYRKKNGLPGNFYKIKTKCDVCSKEYFADRSNYERSKKHICGALSCRKKIMEAPEGTKKSKRGYGSNSHILIKAPNHPGADRNGCIPEHRMIIENELGRFLSKEEVIHHIDMVKNNNKLDNLDLFKNNKEHFLCHGSLNNCVKELISMGILHYDRKKQRYFVRREGDRC